MATNPSDLAVALAAIDALVTCGEKQANDKFQFADFHRLPRRGARARPMSLDRGDLIDHHEVPQA